MEPSNRANSDGGAEPAGITPRCSSIRWTKLSGQGRCEKCDKGDADVGRHAVEDEAPAPAITGGVHADGELLHAPHGLHGGMDALDADLIKVVGAVTVVASTTPRSPPPDVCGRAASEC